MKRTLISLARILFSVGIVIILLLRTNLSELYDVFVHSDYWYSGLALLVSLIGLYLGTLRWQILLKRFDVNVLIYPLFRLICLSLFYNFFIPGGFAGDIIRGYKCKNYDLNGTQGIASVFLDRIMGLVGFIFFGLMGILFTFNLLRGTNLLVGVGVVFISVIVVTGIIFNRKIMSSLKFISKIHVTLYEKLRKCYDYIYYYRNYKRILIYALVVSLITGLTNILAFYLLSVSVGGNVAFVYFVFFIPIITLVSYFPISYSGLGIREMAFTILFLQVGMSRDQALAIPLMYFSLLLFMGILGGIFYITTKRLLLDQDDKQVFVSGSFFKSSEVAGSEKEKEKQFSL